MIVHNYFIEPYLTGIAYIMERGLCRGRRRRRTPPLILSVTIS